MSTFFSSKVLIFFIVPILSTSLYFTAIYLFFQYRVCIRKFYCENKMTFAKKKEQADALFI